MSTKVRELPSGYNVYYVLTHNAILYGPHFFKENDAPIVYNISTLKNIFCSNAETYAEARQNHRKARVVVQLETNDNFMQALIKAGAF